MKVTNTSVRSLKEDILNKSTSFQINTWAPFSKEMTIREVLLEIQSNKHKDQVLNLRNLLQDDKRDEYSSHKRNLAAVTFCGTFEGERKRTNIKSYNSIIVLDVDKLDKLELERTKECLLSEPIVFSFWESPSKEGVKGLVPVLYNFELGGSDLDKAHRGAFQKLVIYFKEKHNIELDNSGSDTTRLCFFSYDPLIVIKSEVIQFEITELDLKPVIELNRTNRRKEVKSVNNRDALYNPSNRNSSMDRSTMNSIIKYLSKRKFSITNSYEEWYKVAMAIANSFTYEVGEGYFLKMSSLDEIKYNEVNCKNFLKNCYESRNGTINFSSIVYLANSKGYLTKKQRDRGTEAVD